MTLPEALNIKNRARGEFLHPFSITLLKLINILLLWIFPGSWMDPIHL